MQLDHLWECVRLFQGLFVRLWSTFLKLHSKSWERAGLNRSSLTSCGGKAKMQLFISHITEKPVPAHLWVFFAVLLPHNHIAAKIRPTKQKVVLALREEKKGLRSIIQPTRREFSLIPSGLVPASHLAWCRKKSILFDSHIRAQQCASNPRQLCLSLCSAWVSNCLLESWQKKDRKKVDFFFFLLSHRRRAGGMFSTHRDVSWLESHRH